MTGMPVGGCSHYLAHLAGRPVDVGRLVAEAATHGRVVASAEGLSAVLRRMHWDERLFRRPCVSIDLIAWPGAMPRPEALGRLVDQCLHDLPDDAFAMTRLALAVMPLARAFEARGFGLADVLTTFVVGPGDLGAPAEQTVRVVPLQMDQAETAVGLAADSLRFGRVLGDPAFTPEEQARWRRAVAEGMVGGAIDGGLALAGLDRRDRMVAMAVGADDPVASAAWGEPRGALQLIATAPECRGQGVGKAMLRAFLRHAGDRWAGVEISTQLDNLAALRLYTQAGLAMAGGMVTLHRHGGGPAR